jgi:sporulation protein YlmC with PRC-barrel domain
MATQEIRYQELEGRDVYNLDGEEIGEIEAVRFDPQTERPVVIIEVGGFLGLGETELAFGYDELTITADRIVLDTVLSEDELEERGEYDEARYQDLPADMMGR